MADTKVIVIPEGKICDYIDGKFRNDTPEEYVRQTVEKRLVNEHKYFPEQIRVEYTLQLGSRKPRADIVIFESKDTAQTQENIKIIIECKKETVDARNAKDGVEQLKSYMSACPNCEWGMWTNGRQKEVFRKYVNDKGQIDFMDYNDIPSADGNLEDINRPSRASLKNAYDDNLLFTFKTCHNHIYVNDGMQKQDILEQFDLAHVWENDKDSNTWKMTDRLQSSVPPEILFVERCTQLLVPGGRMGIVLPDNILGAPGLGYIREWLIKNHRIIASVDLHVDTFQPRNGTQTSVLFLQKKTKEQKDAEEKSGTMADYNIFMAMVDKVGHDKRGNPIFKRDKEGNEILVPDTSSVLVLGKTGDGSRTVAHEQKRKVEDDQTSDVPPIFAEWKKREGLSW